MTATATPFGLQAAAHRSGGIIRQEYQPNGFASGYASNVFTGTPIKRTTDGTFVVCAAGADTAVGVFQGVEYTDTAGVFHVSPYWPTGATYTVSTNGSQNNMQVYFTADPNILYDAQADGSVASTAIGEAINLVGSVTGSTGSGISTQALNHTTTGATPGLATIFSIPEGSYFGSGVNAAGDAFTIVRVYLTPQVPIA
jgi:hypothetical protein